MFKKIMEKKTVKRLPYGNTNFESVRTENYVYIDKTRYIELLENEDNKNLFFTRPRKFGKSLFCSMLSYYYDINQADKFEQLFGDLYIGKHPTPKRNSYLIFRFNFSGLDTLTEEKFNVSFPQKVQDVVRSFMDNYAHLFPKGDIYNAQIDAEQPGAASLQKVLNATNSANKKLYVIIDEYDHFANDLIAKGTHTGDDAYKHIVRSNGIIRDFYETLKEGCDTVIDRIILTGITPITLDDITSGFNITDNLSLDPRYNEVLGFTQDEVNTLMEETGIERSMIHVDMELFYNGYLFHPNGQYKVYNSSMMLFLFKQVLICHDKVTNVIDNNLKTDYDRLKNLMKNKNNRDRLIKIAEDTVITSKIISRFSIDEICNDEHFISLLFYLGMLTIDSYERGRTYLKIPNYSVRTIYWGYVLQLTKDWNKNVHIDSNLQQDAITILAYDSDPKPYIECISDGILRRLSNRDLQNFDEKYIKILILNGIFQSDLYLTVTELEVDNGYVDIYMRRSHLHPDIPYEWVWEIKYVAKKEAQTVLNAKREEARQQLEKYRNSSMFVDRNDVRYLSIIFIGKDKYEIEEIASVTYN
jgi:hypothetical protein